MALSKPDDLEKGELPYLMHMFYRQPINVSSLLFNLGSAHNDPPVFMNLQHAFRTALLLVNLKVDTMSTDSRDLNRLLTIVKEFATFSLSAKVLLPKFN